MNAMTEIMESLSRKRPIFHSEADFQHALALEMAYSDNFCRLRLEKRFSLPLGDEEKEIYMDIFAYLITPEEKLVRAGVELKYLTKNFEMEINGEVYRLKNQSAQDQRRYDFLLDIVRLERLIERGDIDVGYAILLTNDRSYWKEPQKRSKIPNDWDFRIHENRKIEKGTILKWGEETGKNTKKGREDSLRFQGSYTFQWKDYKKFIGQKKR